ncbi:hypothetical protein PSTG_01864 [Puccinia striiformis f. sp. tritici PST-78]|uniref:Uncharacterized protein n=1 Tax=Puccinia striiformis f. sp. tritici PST-78 TaxID=1165861 RepID=A0A0L0VZW4_9BASI|nr:hypothetical protein PSTG_01864 [Puccinia striiformis f. sp. tritici PST-78]
MAVMEDELQRLWQLLAELSSQLTQNREQTEHLKKQAEELKTQAIHTGTGYALKRFNVDLSKEQFESELERMNAQLVIENQTLQHENRHLTILLKDHETTLEQIMTRFRNHAHTTQQHELELTKYYESVLLSILEKQQQQQQHHNNGCLPDGQLHNTQLDPNTFQLIQNLSILIQKAMRELSGEEPYLNETDELESQQALIDSELAFDLSLQPTSNDPAPTAVSFQNPFKRRPPPPSTTAAAATTTTTTTADDAKTDPEQRRKSASVIDYRPRIRDPSSGGYVGKRNGSLSDYALLSAIETERLRRENDYLREMLGIAEDCPPPTLPSINNPILSSTNLNNELEESLPSMDEMGDREQAFRNKLNNNNVVAEVIQEEEEEEEGAEEEEDEEEEEVVVVDHQEEQEHTQHHQREEEEEDHLPNNAHTQDQIDDQPAQTPDHSSPIDHDSEVPSDPPDTIVHLKDHHALPS